MLQAFVDLPEFWLLPDEFLHQLLALFALHIDNLDATLLQIRLSTKKCNVLTNNNSRDPIKYASSGTHVALNQG